MKIPWSKGMGSAAYKEWGPATLAKNEHFTTDVIWNCLIRNQSNFS